MPIYALNQLQPPVNEVSWTIKIGMRYSFVIKYTKNLVKCLSQHCKILLLLYKQHPLLLFFLCMLLRFVCVYLSKLKLTTCNTYTEYLICIINAKTCNKCITELSKFMYTWILDYFSVTVLHSLLALTFWLDYTRKNFYQEYQQERWIQESQLG